MDSGASRGPEARWRRSHAGRESVDPSASHAYECRWTDDQREDGPAHWHRGTPQRDDRRVSLDDLIRRYVKAASNAGQVIGRRGSKDRQEAAFEREARAAAALDERLDEIEAFAKQHNLEGLLEIINGSERNTQDLTQRTIDH